MTPISLPEALAVLDSALAELTQLRNRVAQLEAERDTWRAASGR